MSYHGYSQNTPQYTGQGRPDLHHKVSALSESAYDDPEPSARLQGRDSLVSLQSFYGGPTVTSPSAAGAGRSFGAWSAPFTGHSTTGYEPVGAPGGGAATATTATTQAQGASFAQRMHPTIREEETYDLSLLSGAAPFAGSTSSYSAVPDDDDLGARDALFDLSSFSGPMGAQDAEFMKKLQEQEANGHLTGGLGAGVAPVASIRGNELLTSGNLPKRSLSRSFSLRPQGPSRKATIKGLGQHEANRRGEVIEVIMEDTEEEVMDTVDLSTIAGPAPLLAGNDQRRRSTLTSLKGPGAGVAEVFYPQPNWKPLSMRWPYLCALILISLGLGVGGELLYWKSAAEPLMKFKSPADIKPLDYFALKFVPTLVSVVYGVLWQITDSEVKRLEAFFQMSKEGGALAAESINVDYITLFSFTLPFRAVMRKHYAVAVSSVATILAVSVVPTLSAAALVMNPSRSERISRPDVEKFITINAVLARAFTATLGLIALLGCVLLYQLQTRRTGLLADVKGIAGLASMAVVSHIMMDFKDMDTAPPRDIHKRLRQHRYVLRNSSLAPDDSNPPSTREIDRYAESHLSQNPHPKLLRKEWAIPFIVAILVFLGLIPVFLFTPASIVADKAPWVVTILAVCLKLGWGSLETDIRMMEPYYILSRRHAPARTLTLDYTALPFAWVAVRAALNRHWIVFLVGFGSVLAETLTIFVTSLATIDGQAFVEQVRKSTSTPQLPSTKRGDPRPDGDEALNSGQETTLSITISLGLTAFILVYMFIVAIVVFVRRRHPFLPRQPNTIASVLAFMHQSKMLYDFVGTSKLTNSEMVRKLEGIGKTYGLGWFDGRDGKTHCGIDEEELTGNYKHGIDYSKGNKPWNSDWSLF